MNSLEIVQYMNEETYEVCEILCWQAGDFRLKFLENS